MYCVCVSCISAIYCCFGIVFVLCLCVMCVTSLLYCCTTANGLTPNCSLTNICIYIYILIIRGDYSEAPITLAFGSILLVY
jgi:hypothetical protein